MASRQEEKERRRRERQERERQEAAAASRRRRVQYVFGGLLAVGVLAGLIALGISAFSAGDDEVSAASPTTSGEALPELPAQKETDVRKAADAAGCDLQHPAYEGAEHEEKAFQPSDYKTNPPTSGPHFPTWYDDGIYEPGTVPDLGQLVHTLEHGRINVQYAPGAGPEVVRNLEAFLAETDGYHQLLYENTTDMEYEVAATAWTQLLGCPEYNDRVPDALRTFRSRYVDQGPERVP
jgi:hypothetical protein